MLTFGQLKEAERLILWPSPGEPRNLRLAHDRFFQEAMVELQSWVDVLQNNNTSVFAACSSYQQCAKTVVPAPFGRIKRVYTVANDGFCDPVFYRSRNFNDLDAWARSLLLWWTAPPIPNGFEALPEGFSYPGKTNDGKCGRARIGLWAINRKRLYVTPWLESNESLVVEWDGVANTWSDADVLDEDYWGIDARAAIRAYVKWRHEAEFMCDPQRIRRLKEDYDHQLSDLMYWSDSYTDVQPEIETEAPYRFPSKAEIDASKVPVEAEDDEVFLGNIADFGAVNSDEQAVADLVASKNPEWVLTNGDNAYNSGVDAFERAVGDYYGKWVSNQKFFPVPGNHDWQTVSPASLDPYLAYFSYLPNNKRFYERVFGPLHVFFLDSNAQYPNPIDGSGPTSEQAKWFQARAKLSPARWKVGILHDASYTDGIGNTPGHALSRWDYIGAGMDLVLHGDSHGYQRMEVDGLPIIINGAGGRTRPGFTAPSANSKIIVDAFGAGFITCNCDSLKYEFYDVTGTLRDTLLLTKE